MLLSVTAGAVQKRRVSRLFDPRVILDGVCAMLENRLTVSEFWKTLNRVFACS
jgi:hypothetical protein